MTRGFQLEAPNLAQQLFDAVQHHGATVALAIDGDRAEVRELRLWGQPIPGGVHPSSVAEPMR